jgi:uncharacterized coiled-coil protein SlyX
VNPPPLATLVIDYELLAAGLEPQSASGQSQPLYLYPDSGAATYHYQGAQFILPAGGAATSHEAQPAQAEEIRSLKEDVMKKTTELDVVKEEMRALQRRLTEVQAEAQQAKKRQSALPQRKSIP